MAIIATIAKVLFGSRDYPAKQSHSSKPPELVSMGTVGEAQGKPIFAWSDSDIIKCLRFSATLQLRTPLRVLLRHGESHSDRRAEPPEIACEQWEGIWLPQVFETLYEGEMATDVGAVRAKDYLPFLVLIRTIVESQDSIERRILKLRGLRPAKEWKPYVDKHGGLERIINRFFPDFLMTLPGINAKTAQQLRAEGLTTAAKLADAADATLLAINGIGPSKLSKIRAYCDGLKSGRDSERLDLVKR